MRSDALDRTAAVSSLSRLFSTIGMRCIPNGRSHCLCNMESDRSAGAIRGTTWTGGHSAWRFLKVRWRLLVSHKGFNHVRKNGLH